ncbi:hypothetical protein AX17_004768 [Amanita inopinata Kibby_2008]|nr:hypothetical protein AX17_004768 [Amanita inopinata Kibby_2008]
MLFSTLILLHAAASVLAAPSLRALPTPVSGATARSYLATLTVEAPHDGTGYSRTLFPHWITISGTCDTRETVLIRDGTDVVTDSSCAAVSGHWVSPYDDVPTDLASDLDIDHLVPLKEAWVSGADLWTTSQRQAFANDLTRPQLVAVTDKSVFNLASMAYPNLTPTASTNPKATEASLVSTPLQAHQLKNLTVMLPPDPALWMPPLQNYHCIYVRAWVQVKYYYGLSVDPAEYDALSNYLAPC